MAINAPRLRRHVARVTACRSVLRSISRARERHNMNVKCRRISIMLQATIKRGQARVDAASRGNDVARNGNKRGEKNEKCSAKMT